MAPLALPRGTTRVIARLRKDAPRPSLRHLRMVEADDKHCPRFGFHCPLGLLPSATQPTPGEVDSTGCKELRESEFKRFIAWWDNLTLAQAKRAVGLIWPKKARRK